MFKIFLNKILLLSFICLLSAPLSSQEQFFQPDKNNQLHLLARKILTYSVGLKRGDHVILEMSDSTIPLAKVLIEEIYLSGGVPFVHLYNEQIDRALMMGNTPEQLKMMTEWDSICAKSMDVCIFLDVSNNMNELSDVPSDKMAIYQEYYEHPVTYEIYVPKTRWCYLRYPAASMAQLACMSTEGFEDYFFKACTMDYEKMEKAMKPLADLMKKTDNVRILGQGTDLTFSIKDIPVITCAGRLNLPDGEIFTAPVKNSINGFITFNLPSLYYGTTYDNIHLEFKNGKIINATANDTKRINQVLDTDEGARYVGEFSFGVNPFIEKPVNDILFDEKIRGSFHMALGNAYDMAYNGNKSAIHWDLIQIQTEEYGGGEIWFDGKLIRKNGLFVMPELEGLNPEYL